MQQSLKVYFALTSLIFLWSYLDYIIIKANLSTTEFTFLFQYFIQKAQKPGSAWNY